MDFSARNRKVAISRWKKIHSSVRLSNNFSKEKAAITSYLSGDGWIRSDKHDSRYEIRFFLDDLQLAERVVKLFENEFNVHPKIKKIESTVPEGRGYFKVEISNKPVCEHLLKLGTYGGLTWTIPDKLNEECKREWIRCFFDCEAYVNIKKRQIQLKSINGKGLCNLQKLLEEELIFPKIYGPYKQKGQNHNPYYFLIILGKANIARYSEKIGFYHTRKIESLSKLIESLHL